MNKNKLKKIVQDIRQMGSDDATDEQIEQAIKEEVVMHPSFKVYKDDLDEDTNYCCKYYVKCLLNEKKVVNYIY